MSLDYEDRNPMRTKIYRTLGQGLSIFHEAQDPDIDIVAIPRLGANPEESWTWTSSKGGPGRSIAAYWQTPENTETPQQDSQAKKEFNWIRDKDGLASLYPKSRVMLYDYASAWQGSRKVRATMKSICIWLLDDLSERRKSPTEITRPLIFIGHSMAGIIIAKTWCMAKARKEFEAILTCTVGCVFLGAPFEGSSMARVALAYSSVFGSEAYEALLSFMQTGNNDTLDEVREDFVEICNNLDPSIELLCEWEQVATDASYAARITDNAPRLLQHKAFTAGIRAVLDLSIRQGTVSVTA
ncbi:hypothetical protein EJ03DRAFT_112885 [Teratosphaeria nubilosa]|uniref:DUF676 domain-containing protein n=1 Tax=Teratosphaeria nubilosa TaxID=161662 RepID=A0A6G1L7E6_9PEZI|nr:hypothetical protein EJ03DRAFT_112885 [Teratosphaeria nubilosa]